MLPTLTTHRLLLRPAEPSDVEALWSLWTHPDVRRYLWDDRAITREEAATTLEDCLALDDQGLGLWRVEQFEADDPTSLEAGILGCAALLPVGTAAQYEPRLAGLVEPLVALSPKFWRRGYAHEALCVLLEHAAAVLRLSRVAGVTDVPNVRSDRMLRRAGFVVFSEVAGPRYPLRTYLRDGLQRTNTGTAHDELVDAYLHYAEAVSLHGYRGDLPAAWDQMRNLLANDPEGAWQVIQALVRRCIRDEVLAYIAAGPLEDLLCAHPLVFIDRVESLARTDLHFRRALSGVWGWERMPPEVLARIDAILAGEPRL